MARSSAAEWAERVSAWRSSGLTSKEFCRGREFNSQTLLWWSSQLLRGKVRVSKESNPRVALARVVTRASVVEGRTVIRIEVGGARVEVAAGADRATLTAVLESLRDAPTGAAR
jgi:hypothetical protein